MSFAVKRSFIQKFNYLWVSLRAAWRIVMLMPISRLGTFLSDNAERWRRHLFAAFCPGKSNGTLTVRASVIGLPANNYALPARVVPTLDTFNSMSSGEGRCRVPPHRIYSWHSWLLLALMAGDRQRRDRANPPYDDMNITRLPSSFKECSRDQTSGISNQVAKDAGLPGSDPE
jgi:hypothetical protein